MKLDRLFNRAEDKNVAATYVYVKSGETKAYAEADYKTQLDAATLANLFEKGMIIVDGGAKYIPATCKVASGTATVTYVTIGASNAATLKSIVSSATE